MDELKKGVEERVKEEEYGGLIDDLEKISEELDKLDEPDELEEGVVKEQKIKRIESMEMAENGASNLIDDKAKSGDDDIIVDKVKEESTKGIETIPLLQPINDED